MNSALSNARYPGESFSAYRDRLKAVARQLRSYLKGRLVHVSSKIVILPMVANEPNLPIDEAIKRGDIRDVVRQTLATGETIRVGRERGVTAYGPGAGRGLIHPRRVRRELLRTFKVLA